MVAGLKGNFKILLLSALILGSSICVQANAPSSQGLPPGELVDIKNETFNPDNLTVTLNTTVIWANHETNPIEIVADDNSFDSGAIYPNGYEYGYVFLQPGVYGYHSKDNPSMHGQVVVANANGTLPKITKTPASPAQANKTAQAKQTAQKTTVAPSQNVAIGLMAKNIAFNASKITVSAGTQVTINFDNQDGGVPHNFALYQSSSSTNAIFKGEIITGPRKTTYTFTAPSNPGNYYFQCDVHPTQMNGQFVVTPSGGSQPSTGGAATGAATSAATGAATGRAANATNATSRNASSSSVSPGNATSSNAAPTNATANAAPSTGSNATSPSQSKNVSISLTAKNIAFDKKTMTAPAGSLVTINFDNQDGGVPHNFALYQSSAATNAIFKGDIITGPRKTTYTFTAPPKPGIYYYQCDVHPTQMNGKFIIQ